MLTVTRYTGSESEQEPHQRIRASPPVSLSPINCWYWEEICSNSFLILFPFPNNYWIVLISHTNSLKIEGEFWLCCCIELRLLTNCKNMSSNNLWKLYWDILIICYWKMFTGSLLGKSSANLSVSTSAMTLSFNQKTANIQLWPLQFENVL